MKHLSKTPFIFLPACVAFLSLSVQAQEPLDFEEADGDGNGLLSAEEASAALPGVNVQDSNGDGWLNHAEIESAVEGLDLYEDLEGGEDSVVGIFNYRKIVDHITGPVIRDSTS